MAQLSFSIAFRDREVRPVAQQVRGSGSENYWPGNEQGGAPDVTVDTALDTQRIDHLLDGFDVGQVEITSWGSGAAARPCSSRSSCPACAGGTLFDPDVLEPVNLVKLPRPGPRWAAPRSR